MHAVSRPNANGFSAYFGLPIFSGGPGIVAVSSRFYFVGARRGFEFRPLIENFDGHPEKQPRPHNRRQHNSTIRLACAIINVV